MSGWLDSLRAALDEAPAPIAFFLRDDDAGWDDERLFAVADVVERHRLPLDLAVIPGEVSETLADSLAARHAGSDRRLGLHQHGLAHANHESSGRKCEFGPTRRRGDQRRDIALGRELLEALLPGLTQPLFTPPWNRCTETTGELLVELGFQVLSRHVSEPALDVRGLVEVSVSVDWTFAKRGGVRLTWPELAALAASQVRLGEPVGVNLHHAEMNRDELGLLDQLCDLLCNHESVRCLPLLAVATDARANP